MCNVYIIYGERERKRETEKERDNDMYIYIWVNVSSRPLVFFDNAMFPKA